MLPGNLQYWKPCSFLERMMQTMYFGSKDFYIDEPVHFSGPSPKDPPAVLSTEEEKKEPVEKEPVQQPDEEPTQPAVER